MARRDDFIYKTYLYFYEPNKLLPLKINNKAKADTSFSYKYSQTSNVIKAPISFNPFIIYSNGELSINGDSIILESTFILNKIDTNLIKEIGKVVFKENNKYQIKFLLSELIYISMLPIIDSIDHKVHLLLQLLDSSD